VRRLTRRLRPDRNPLRRTAYRVEAAIMASLPASPGRLARSRARVRVPALAGAGLILVVALGAANCGGVNAAPSTLRAKRRTCMFDRGRTAS
jgi:hypothetical protein